MSIKVAIEVWRGSQHKSGNLLVLLALADHADDQGKAWPGIPLLARKAQRPVKLIYDRAEDIAATTKRHPGIIRHRTGVTRDGRLTASEIFCPPKPKLLLRTCSTRFSRAWLGT